MNSPVIPNPQALQRVRDVVPDGFESYRQFLNWKLVKSRKIVGKLDKVPCTPDGHTISAHDPANWISALEAASSPHGIGFVFTRNDPFGFVDLDRAWDGSAWSETATAIIGMFPGAAVEVSHSGTGLHLMFSGSASIPADHKCNVPGIEFYTAGRFVALTGTHKQGSASVDFSRDLPAFVARYELEPAPASELASVAAGSGPAPGYTGPEDDAELLRLMEASRGGIAAQFGDTARAWDLWTGNADVLAKRYPDVLRGDGCTFDRSEADAALMSHLAFWTGADRERMVRLFMQSALARPEHYAEKGGYRMTKILDLAIGKCTKVYDRPRLTIVPEPGSIDALFFGHPKPTLPPEALREPPANWRDGVSAFTLDDGTPAFFTDAQAVAPGGRLIAATTFTPRPERDLQPRAFLYGTDYIRRETSATFSPGGIGKTAHAVAEILSMVTGKRLLDEMPKRPLRVIYFGEEPRDEIERRFIAAVKYYGIDWQNDVADRLVIHSLRDEPLTIAKLDAGRRYDKNPRDVDAVKHLINSHHADVMFFDTMKKIHQVEENDNGHMDALIAELNGIAQSCNVAIMLLAHTRKVSSFQTSTIDDARGARGQVDATRVSRMLARMTTDQANKLNIDHMKVWQYIRIGDSKENMSPPADVVRWMKLTNVTLDNHRPFDDLDHDGPDRVQVVTMYNPPKVIETISEANLNEIRDAVASMSADRLDARAKTWIGHAIGQVLNITTLPDEDVTKREIDSGKRRVSMIIQQLIDDGVLDVYQAECDQRKQRDYVRFRCAS